MFYLERVSSWICVTSPDKLFLGVVKHPQLGFKLWLVKDVVEQGQVWCDFSAFADIESVGQLKFVDDSPGRNNVPAPEWYDFRIYNQLTTIVLKVLQFPIYLLTNSTSFFILNNTWRAVILDAGP